MAATQARIARLEPRIHRYYEALARVSPRARYWKIGTSEEGRDIVALAIADEATIASLETSQQ